MKSRLIVMLTHNDKTVEDAISYFDGCKDLPIEYWGFKDVGLPHDEMKSLTAAIKAAGKKSVLEIVSYTEAECMDGARMAVEFGFDYLMGTLFFPSVWEYLKDKPIQYLPFVGNVHGSPSVLEGSCEEMTEETKKYINDGVFGCDLLAFRHTGNGEALARSFVAANSSPVVIAGSISSYERIKFMSELDPWGFTMGSALFEGKFIPNGTFRDNLKKVLEIMGLLP